MKYTIKVLGASSSKADANLYLDGEKVGEVVIKREAGSDIRLYHLLGEQFVLEERVWE